MGKRIDELADYGSYDLDKMLSDIIEISKNSGTSGAPVYASNGSRQVKLSDFVLLLSAISTPAKVTSLVTIALLEDDANWTLNLYTGTPITGQKTGDWFDNGLISYKFVTGNAVISRIPYSLL